MLNHQCSMANRMHQRVGVRQFFELNAACVQKATMNQKVLISPLLASCMLVFLLPARGRAEESKTVNWPSFRGVQASGVANGFKTPERWGSTSKWKTPIPGLGHACPIVWEDKLFVTTAVTESGDDRLKVGLYGSIEPVKDNTQHSWQVFCLNKKDGLIIWKRSAVEGAPKIQRHPKSTHANSTPATDGKHLVCFFGAEGMFCFDLDGNLLWQKNFGSLNSGYYVVPNAEWGFGSSPVIHENRVIVQCDVQTNSFIAAFDLQDGKELWKKTRIEVPTWSTPTVNVREGRTQVIANGYQHMGGYDLRTGDELWKLKRAGDIPVPTPIVAHDLIFLTSAHGPLSPIYAIRGTATGDISLQPGETRNAHIAWSVGRGGNYMQTPIVVGDYLYCGQDHGVVNCFTAKTGEKHYSERLGTGVAGFTASPVAADGKIYFTSEEGIVYVLRAGPKFEVVSQNALGETCMATPAISEGTLFFRTRNHVVAIVGP